MPLVSIVTPFYNEGPGIEDYFRSIIGIMDSRDDVRFEVVCVDDGSSDSTLAGLMRHASGDPRIRVIELSRNFGKEAALTAGIDFAAGDAVIPLDADLQDPPEVIHSLIQGWQDGADVVLARRGDRSTDSLLKRTTARWFYQVHNLVSPVPIPENVGDFRLLNRDAVQALRALPEQQRFMKGLFAWVGFRTTVIEYRRQPRTRGRSRFSGWKLWNLALDGITSFSTAPLRIWTYLGLATASLTLAYAAYIVLRTLISGVDLPGYASLLTAVLFLGSLQLISVGILGEYIGRIYVESKHRPKYVVRRTHGLTEPGDPPAGIERSARPSEPSKPTVNGR